MIVDMLAAIGALAVLAMPVVLVSRAAERQAREEAHREIMRLLAEQATRDSDRDIANNLDI